MTQVDPAKHPVSEQNSSDANAEFPEKQHHKPSQQRSNLSAKEPDEHQESHNTNKQLSHPDQPHGSSNDHQCLQEIVDNEAKETRGVVKEDSQKHCDNKKIESDTAPDQLNQKQPPAKSENQQPYPQQQQEQATTRNDAHPQQEGEQAASNSSLTQRDQKRNFLAGLIAGASTAGVCEAITTTLLKAS